MRRFLFLLTSALLVPLTSAAEPWNEAGGAVRSPVALPAAPTIDDPMLAPIPPAATNVATWQGILELIRARSTDLRTAYDEVLRASGMTRSALASAFPTICLLYTSPSPRDGATSRMPSSA